MEPTVGDTLKKAGRKFKKLEAKEAAEKTGLSQCFEVYVILHRNECLKDPGWFRLALTLRVGIGEQWKCAA